VATVESHKADYRDFPPVNFFAPESCAPRGVTTENRLRNLLTALLHVDAVRAHMPTAQQGSLPAPDQADTDLAGLVRCPADVVLLRGLIADLRRNANQCNAVAQLLEGYLTAPPPAPPPPAPPPPVVIASAPSNRRILRLPQVCERVGLSRASIYRLIAEQQFSAPVHLAGRSVVGRRMPWMSG